MIQAIVLSSLLLGQTTQVDLSKQSKAVDFSAAANTKPAKAGTTLPATCTVGEMFFKTDSAAGQNLHMCTSTNFWTQVVGSGGGGGGAATSGSQLLDLQVTRSTTTILTIGANCSVSAPCVVRFGVKAYSITASATATISGSGTGVAAIYVSSAGDVTVVHNLTVACSVGCLAVSGTPAFPADSIPLYTWTATSGQWDAGGGVDFRSWLSTKNVAAGVGILVVEANGLATLSVDGTVVPTRVAIPGTATTACTSGQWASDTSFFYSCVASNTWRRVAIASW